MPDAFIYDGLRTPIGRHAGGRARVGPDDLRAGVIKGVGGRSPFKAEHFEDAVIGCPNQAGEDARTVARHAALLGGLPTTIGGLTVNRLCGSGLAAIADAGRATRCGEGALFIAGGVESMSRAPFVTAKSESPYAREVRVFDSTIGARFPNPRIGKIFGEDTMPETADNVGKDLAIGREASDRFAAASQAKYAAAKAAGFFDGEIAPVAIGGRKGAETIVAQDEHPRPNTTYDRLAELKPLFPGGVVTAGNASGLNDGAAALVIGTEAIGETAGAKPMARIVSAAVAGVEPRVMGLGPVPASQKALERAGLTLKDIDVIELNEAFATQVLGCLKLLKIEAEDSRVNPNGGAISVGHPLGASGARLGLTAIRELQRTGGGRPPFPPCIRGRPSITPTLQRVLVSVRSGTGATYTA